MPLKSAKRSGVSCPASCWLSLRSAQQIVDQRLGVDLLLDVERRRVDDEVAPVLLILPAPDELGIEVGVARVAESFRFPLLFLHHRLVFGRGDIFSFGLVVAKRLDGLSKFDLPSHI